MRPLLPIVFFLSACRQDAPATDQSPSGVTESASACESRNFEGSRFTLCSLAEGKVEIVSGPEGGPAYRGFDALAEALGPRASEVAFAMNAGMFDSDGEAIGLLIENGEQLHTLNRNRGGGNFHLLPNGVFLVRKDGSAAVVTSEDFVSANDIAYASQSGPMLLIDGKLHPRFDEDGESRHIRNGVGIRPDGTPVFVISADPVSFGKFARLFRDEVKAKNALYFDGAVSSLWEPEFGRMDLRAPIGPMVVVFHRR